MICTYFYFTDAGGETSLTQERAGTGAVLVHRGGNEPIAAQHPEPVEGCGFAQVSRLDPHPSTSSGC